MSETTEKRSLLSRIGRWTAELVLVFVGVYAAFWLNSYQQRQQDGERRDRILASIEKTLTEGIESNKISRAKQQHEATEFRRALDAGEMPALRPFVFTTDYNPATSPRYFNPAAFSCLTWKRLLRCGTTNPSSGGD